MVKKLKLNFNKTRSMLLYQSKNCCFFFKLLDLNEKIVIKNISSYRYLGTNLDKSLNWSKHIETIKTKFLKTLDV